MTQYNLLQTAEATAKSYTSWIWTGFLDSLPKNVRTLFLLGQARLEIERVDADGFSAVEISSSGRESRRWHLTRGQRLPLRFLWASKRMPLLLRVKSDLVLSRDIRLLRDAVRNLDHVVALNLESWTSFKREESAIAARLVRIEGNEAFVELAILPSNVVSHELHLLSTHGMNLDGAISEKPERLFIFPKSRIGSLSRSVIAKQIMIALGFILLCTIVYRIELIETTRKNLAVKEIADLLTAAKANDSSIRVLEQQKREANKIFGELATRYSVAERMGSISSLLPEQAFVSRFEWTRGATVVEFDVPSGSLITSTPTEIVSQRLPPVRSGGDRYVWTLADPARGP